MDKVILRKKILGSGRVNSNFIALCSDYKRDFENQSDLIKEIGWNKIMEFVFEEKINGGSLENSALYKSYVSISNRDTNQNEDFVRIYKINESFGVYLDANIYLFHLPPKGNLIADIVPWYYSDGQIYLGDTWWESDDEILDNLKNLSVLDFLEIYKGWAFDGKKLF